jgi:hypothetical protein
MFRISAGLDTSPSLTYVPKLIHVSKVIKEHASGKIKEKELSHSKTSANKPSLKKSQEFDHGVKRMGDSQFNEMPTSMLISVESEREALKV